MGKPEKPVKLTARSVAALPAGRDKGSWHADAELPGFYVIAFSSGIKTFVARFRTPEGRRGVMKIGRFGAVTAEQAREKAKEILSRAQLGSDPAGERRRRREIPTCKKWAEVYLQRIALRKKSPREDHRFIPRAVKAWGERPVDSITREDVERLHQSFQETPTSANRALASWRAWFSAAVAAGYVTTNPAKGIRPFREADPRARVLAAEEMERVLRAIAAEPDVFARAALSMLVETGARLSEALRARWEDLSFEDGTWRIPSPKTGRPQVMPLAKTTLAALKALRRLNHQSPFLFPGRFLDRPRADLRDAWDRVREAAGVKDVRIHDLRRTFGLAVARSAGLHVASKLLRHSSVKVTEAVYAPLGIEDLRAAMEKRAEVLSFPNKAASAPRS